MNRLAGIILNTLFFTVVVVIAFTIATVAITKKVNEARLQYSDGLKGTVVKQVVPVLAFSRGIVKAIHVKVGQEIRKDDLLIELENPVLAGKIKALENYPDNISAKTESTVAQEEIKGLKIYSPANGVVTDILVTEGSPVEDLAKLINVYSNENIMLVANLTDDQYLAIQQLHEARAYSRRLNQHFIVQPDILKPDVKGVETGEKKIGLFFTFKDKQEATSLLNNEDLDMLLVQNDSKITKPVDYIVNFWNTLLLPSKKHAI